MVHDFAWRDAPSIDVIPVRLVHASRQLCMWLNPKLELLPTMVWAPDIFLGQI